MLICYKNVMQLDPEARGEKCRFMLSNSGLQSGIMVSLDSTHFRVEYKDGIGEVCLSRHLTTAQARDLATKLTEVADANEKLSELYEAEVADANEKLSELTIGHHLRWL